MTTIINGDSNINLDFTTGGRITGDFSNATLASRAMFQTSTANGNTSVGAVPNGTSVTANYRVFNNSDTTNCAFGSMFSSNADISFASDRNGTGTYLPMTFSTGGSESLRLSQTSKAVILAGGSTSANGTGITFPATQSASSDANTLDDYEEGTWTPSVGGTATYSGQLGTYTKIGRQVFAYFDLTIATIGTGTTSAFSGLPFTSISSGGDGMGGSIGYFSALTTAVVSICLRVDRNTTSAYAWSLTSAAGILGNPAILGGGTRITGTCIYITN